MLHSYLFRAEKLLEGPILGPITVSNAGNNHALPNMGYLAHNKPADPPEPVTPQFGRTSISPQWERRDSFNSLPADLHSGQTVKGLGLEFEYFFFLI